VDWRRVGWYDSKAGLPARVPLKPWLGHPGRTWVLEFKSYDQGREALQARAIGGFLFTEQFPWSLLTEVLRGCREYDFPGSKICEFTPVDPALSVELEQLLETDTLPDGWDVFRANTECAMEAGHVSEAWFREFFGMISDEMRETRMTGMFASYEGTIYQQFNPSIHLCTEEEAFPNGDFPPGVWHRRAIDWGAGPANAFVCLWGYRDGLGCWTIYDEYWSTDQTRTVNDHVKAISDQWPWPRNKAHWGMTYADPSAPEHLRLASRFSEYVPGYDNISIPSGRSLADGQLPCDNRSQLRAAATDLFRLWRRVWHSDHVYDRRHSDSRLHRARRSVRCGGPAAAGL
jgi:phage terminase large subunit-like protein